MMLSYLKGPSQGEGVWIQQRIEKNDQKEVEAEWNELVLHELPREQLPLRVDDSLDALEFED